MGHYLVRRSVLLATYQGEAYLSPLIDSLLHQTCQDFQVLFQDDGSTDRTRQLLASVSRADSRFLPGSEQGKHLGAAGNFLSLMRQAEADTVFLCDQDDLWEPEKIARLSDCMQDAEWRFGADTPVLIHSDSSVIGSDGEVIAPSFFRLQGWDPGAVTLPPLLVQNNATGCTMALNRPLADLIRKYGHAEKMFMHDWFIVLSAAAFGHVIFLDQPLVRYRQHEGNVIGASRSSLFQRSIAAFRARQKAKERIALTYSHTQAFAEAYGEALPDSAKKVIHDYLATQNMPKFARIRAVRRQGCVMQSPITRAGQILFG